MRCADPRFFGKLRLGLGLGCVSEVRVSMGEVYFVYLGLKG